MRCVADDEESDEETRVRTCGGYYIRLILGIIFVGPGSYPYSANVRFLDVRLLIGLRLCP